MNLYKKLILATTTCLLAANSAQAFTVTIEAPTIQSTQLTNDLFTVNFNDQTLGEVGFNLTNNDTTYTYGSDLRIDNHNQWGGANESKFITNAAGQGSYTVAINQDQKYFGFWWSAGDSYNKITFKNDGEEVAVFRTSDLVDFINSSGISNTLEYYGNPNSSYVNFNGGHKNEPYAFVNVFFDSEAYDEIVVETMTDNGAAFESDNHAYSATKQDIRGTVVAMSYYPD